MLRTIKKLICLLLVVFAPRVSADETPLIEVNAVRLYLPDATLRQRIGSDVAPMADYIKALNETSAAFWRNGPPPSAKGVLVAVGVKPGKQVKVWCEAIEGTVPEEVLVALEKKLTELPAMTVKAGPVAFAIEHRFRGQQPENFPQIPKAWAEAAKKAAKPLKIPDELFTVIWPDKQ